MHSRIKDSSFSGLIMIFTFGMMLSNSCKLYFSFGSFVSRFINQNEIELDALNINIA
ncbi:MAG: hypothetical protein ACI93S_000783 [Ancylomarina sp.]|jgi:hypothetical protein